MAPKTQTEKKQTGKAKAKAKAKKPAVDDDATHIDHAFKEAADEPQPNMDYMVAVQGCIEIIKSEFPGIMEMEPLPLEAKSADDLPGFLSSFDPEVYTKQYQDEGEALSYIAGINFFWMDLVGSLAPFIPLSECRVRKLIPLTCPDNTKQFKETVEVAVDFSDGNALTKGALVRITPDEIVHAKVFSTADYINTFKEKGEDIPSHIKKQILRSLLSVPCRFLRIDKHDLRYTAMLLIRRRIAGIGEIVKLTARQEIYNIHGFKMRKEFQRAPMGAGAIAQFYEKHLADSGADPVSKTTVDQALTVHDRIFSIPAVEKVIADYDDTLGQASPFNSISRLQEVVYRGKTQDKIEWFVLYLKDNIDSKKIDITDITKTTIKQGTKTSISDIALIQLKVKNYLLGKWLETIYIMPEIKATLRTIFVSHASYRTMWNPLQGQVDTTFVYSWCAGSKKILELIELIVFSDDPTCDERLRIAAHKYMTPEEVLLLYPFKDLVVASSLAAENTASAGACSVRLR